MSDFLGARISLISKSDIRYSGVLHDISSEDSTVSLENVISYGTEGRRGKPEDEIPPADQIYEYIVFRGSDVKDLRIEETPATKPMPSAVPNDPAILGARPRPGNNNAPPPFRQGPPQGPPQQGGPAYAPNVPMPPNAGGWGPNGPSPRNYPYPPPPGWYPPPGPGFGPAGPQWNNNFYPPGPPPPQQFAPGPAGANNANNNARPSQGQQPVGGRPPSGAPKGPAAAPAPEPKSLGQAPAQPAPGSNRATPTAPSAANVQKPGPPPSAPTPTSAPAEAAPALPTGPRNATRIAPIVPLPAGLVNKTVTQTTVIASKQTSGDASALRDATLAAKAAVAVAMAKLGESSAAAGSAPASSGPSAQPSQYANASSAMDNLARKVNEMSVNAARADGSHSNNGYSNAHPRGRGRDHYTGHGGHRAPRVDVPDTEYDFASANAKFNKEDVVKEAIAGSNPEPDAPSSAAAGASDAGTADADPADPPVAYNKTKSFFDNISSEAKDRAANSGQRAGGREWRGEEQRRNMETFGQGSVDGGYRSYRGRGRGRGRGGYNRGRGGNRRNNDAQQGTAPWS